MKTCRFIKKETPANVFSCEICQVLRSTFFTEYYRWLFLEHYENFFSEHSMVNFIKTDIKVEIPFKWNSLFCFLGNNQAQPSFGIYNWKFRRIHQSCYFRKGVLKNLRKTASEFSLIIENLPYNFIHTQNKAGFI